MTDPHTTMSEADAAALTERIRDEAERTWALLVEAHDGYAWAAMGYGSWDDYVTTEFDPAASAALRLVERARVGMEHDVEDGGVPDEVHLSASEVQDFVGQVVLSLEALTMGLDMVDLSTLPADPQAAGVIAEAIDKFHRLLEAVRPEDGATP